MISDEEEDIAEYNQSHDINFIKANAIKPNVGAKFEELFDSFVQANSSKSIYKCFEAICDSLSINRKEVFENGCSLAQFVNGSSLATSKYAYQYRMQQKQQLMQLSNQPPTRLVYQIIKAKTDYWKANELWKKYDKRLNMKDYAKQLATFKDLNVLIIGCGPVGLRLSIECALMGLRCTIVEKRDRFSRNNVLHLWPYTIIDLKNLGAKLFYGKFCAGSIDHISIRKLQCILLK